MTRTEPQHPRRHGHASALWRAHLRRRATVREVGRSFALRAGMTPRALIVEDHPATRIALRDYFEAGGFTVDSAGSLPEAIALLEAHRYAIAFTDLRLNGHGEADGFEVLSAMRSRAPASPVVLLTSMATPQVVAEARRRGAAGVLTKPQRLADLLRLARDLSATAGPSA